jgi:hypothetical protein
MFLSLSSFGAAFLKPDSPRLLGNVQNEALCLTVLGRLLPTFWHGRVIKRTATAHVELRSVVDTLGGWQIARNFLRVVRQRHYTSFGIVTMSPAIDLVSFVSEAERRPPGWLGDQLPMSCARDWPPNRVELLKVRQFQPLSVGLAPILPAASMPCSQTHDFGLRRVVFVGDRGMVTSQNLERLRRSGHGYVVGRNRRRSEEVYEYTPTP